MLGGARMVKDNTYSKYKICIGCKRNYGCDFKKDNGFCPRCSRGGSRRMEINLPGDSNAYS